MLELQAILQPDFLVIEKLKLRQGLLFPVPTYFNNLQHVLTFKKCSVKKQIWIYEFISFCYGGHHFKKETGT